MRWPCNSRRSGPGTGLSMNCRLAKFNRIRSLAAKENSYHLFSQGAGVFGGHSEIAGNINDRYPADLTFTELHDTLDFW